MSDPKPERSDQAPSRWPHRLAWALACAAFALICVGGAVTSYQAGMAVPDWPTTYGHWFYPLQLWLWKWSDLLLEHGHRTLAQLVGVLTIALAVVLWALDRRKWMRWLALAAVGGVVVQGTLGGLRVIYDDLLLAKVHGCTAPLFFGLCVLLVALTSPVWRQPAGPAEHPSARGLHRLASGTAVAVYLMIVLGSQLRHLSPQDAPGWFEFWVWTKLICAGLTAIAVAWLLVYVLRRARDRPTIVRRANLLGVLLLVQVVLGAGAWVTKYGFPAWFTDYFWTVEYTVVQEGRLQVWVRTGHAAVGSLTLAAALVLAAWSFRLLKRPAA